MYQQAQPGIALRAVEEQKAVDYLKNLYEKLFETRFGSKPILVEDDTHILRWLAINFKQADKILRTYLSYQDEWVIKKAYPLGWLKKNINEILAAGAKLGKIEVLQYVVSFTVEGHPHWSTNMNYMGAGHWYKPVPLEEWKEQTLEEKLLGLKNKPTTEPIDQWIRNWKEWGFLKEVN